MREYGSEQPAIVLPDEYFEHLKDFGRETTFLRCGREALLYASYNCKSEKDATILFPAYCCWSMSAPFIKSGWRIVYYRLNKDLTIDLEYIEYLLKKETPQAILTMNYYGSTDTATAITRIKAIDKNIIVLEDFSHCTFSLKYIWNDQVDYYVSSIRKQIGVCDGAVIMSKKPCNKDLIEADLSEFANNRFVAQTAKRHYTFNKKQESKETFLNIIHECEGIINNFSTIHPISERGKQMLTMINGKEIAYARRENMKHLWNLLNGKVKMIPKIERSFDYAPFSLPILVKNRDTIQQLLAKRGVYAPVLWPLCDEAIAVCPNSAYIADHMLSIPIDQRYNWDDIEDMAATILDILHNNA